MKIDLTQKKDQASPCGYSLNRDIGRWHRCIRRNPAYDPEQFISQYPSYQPLRSYNWSSRGNKLCNRVRLH